MVTLSGTLARLLFSLNKLGLLCRASLIPSWNWFRLSARSRLTFDRSSLNLCLSVSVGDVFSLRRTVSFFPNEVEYLTIHPRRTVDVFDGFHRYMVAYGPEEQLLPSYPTVVNVLCCLHCSAKINSL